MKTDYSQHIEELIESSGSLLSDMLPSDWAAAHRVMSTEVSPFPGRFKWSKTPYAREILDCISPGHPAHTVAVMKGAQIGFSTAVIENAIGYIIAQNPGNILFLTGHADLAEEAMSGKIDNMIDSCGLRSMIRPNALRKKNQRTGDTNKSKEFPGGSLVAGSAGNHKLLRQRSTRFGFVDDFDAAKGNTKESGDTTSMITQRFAAYGDKRKVFYISTPEVKQTSNIEPAYLLGDQRRYFCPCPKCGDHIAWYWTIQVDKETCGMTWETDAAGDLIESSVGYKCQSCFQIFKDNEKHDMLQNGVWKPTAKPSTPGYYSYHISALYAPPGMFDWTHYVRQYLEANPKDRSQDPKKMQAFVNLVLGDTYEAKGQAPKANQLQRNVRDYEINIVPEKLSESDGNGSIVLLTCACDLNGHADDARLDYEVTAWSESGATYSVVHGSIGTFIPNESGKKNKVDRERWTYSANEKNSVWPLFQEVIEKVYRTESGVGKTIVISGVDTGHYTKFAYDFIEEQNGKNLVVGLKGKDSDKYRAIGKDTPTFRLSRERGDLYLVEVNQIKDDLAELMKLRWNTRNDMPQPHGFMNFPIPSAGLYTFKNFFSHFEAEQRIVQDKADGVSTRWVKVNSAAQNHHWDCTVYNIAVKDIIVSMIGKELKQRPFLWVDFVRVMTGQE
jgi:phage terminase large subunit GpA-like protein